ncbi:MAG TPA: hypothetical protein VLA77_04275 [Candidatus Saccharimonadales bacterium]|nr:hypothetical protein [Candidatus Saccharimonadales bacterium]
MAKAGKDRVRQAAAGLGIIGMIFGAGSTSGGVPKKTFDAGSSLYRSGRSQQRQQQSSHLRSGTDSSNRRRGGSGQR